MSSRTRRGPGRDRRADTVPPAVKKERSARLRALSDELCRRRWRAKLGTTDRVLVDRPGRGYGDDYTPWLVDAEVGTLVERAQSGSRRKGSSPLPPEDCLFCRLVAEGDHVAKGDGFVAIRDINPLAETHLLVLPERHVDSFRDIGEFPDDEAGRMLRFVAETARDAGSRGLPRARERRRGRGRRSSTCTGTCSAAGPTPPGSRPRSRRRRHELDRADGGVS